MHAAAGFCSNKREVEQQLHLFFKLLVNDWLKRLAAGFIHRSGR